MTPDKIERTIEFILEHQAQVAVNMEKLTVNMDQLTGQTRNVQRAILILSDLTQVQSSRLDRQGEQVQALLKRYDETQEKILDRIDEIVRRLTERN